MQTRRAPDERAKGTTRIGVRHVAATLACATLAVWCTWPLAAHLATTIPGGGAGDNVTFLWNVWAFGQGLAHGSIFWTPMVFAPFGTSLVLDTYVPLESGAAWLLARAVPLVAAHNLVLLAGLTADGALAYALAWHYTHRWIASVAGGMAFAASAFVQIHLLGHFNLVHAWVLPAAALAAVRAGERPGVGRGVWLGAALAAATYTDYYYALYAWLMALALWTWPWVSFEWHVTRRNGLAWARRAVLVLIGVDALMAGAVAWSGRTAVDWAGWHVSLTSHRNQLTAFWLLAAIWVGARYRGAAHVRVDAHEAGRSVPAVVSAAVCYLLAVAPLLVAVVRLVAAGHYAAPAASWLNSPSGVDLATVLLGSPRHALVGPAALAAYRRLGIDLMEQCAWIGVVTPILIAVAGARGRLGAPARVWLAVGAVFLVWAFGPFLRVAGANTALPLPDALLRYLPVLSNARMPGRALIVVQLAAAVLVAMAIATCRTRRWMAGLAIAVFVVDGWPAPSPLYTLPAADAVDAAVAGGAPGAVAELPLGLRDGFGETGRFDDRALVHQMAHGRPIVGGFVARLSPRLQQAYRQSPLLATLLRLSAGDPGAALPASAAADARLLGLAYIVVDRDSLPATAHLASADLVRAGFVPVLRAGPRELYAVPRAGA